MMQLGEVSQGQKQWPMMFAALFLVALIGWMDYLISWELNLFVVYSLPIVIVVWKMGWRLGFLFAFLCAATWWFAQIESNPYRSTQGFALAVFSRLFFFSVLVVAVALVKSRREHYRDQIRQLEREHELERKIIQVSEREQQRIGRDLHDSLGQHLAAIGYAMKFLVNDLRNLGQPQAAQAEKIRELLSDAVSLTRDLAHGIFPAGLKGSGLSTALEQLAGSVTRMTDKTVTFHETAGIRVDDPEQALHFYRIAQEAVNNAVKHGGSKKITIMLSERDGMLRLAVTDDGHGIVPSHDENRGMGIDSMRYRAKILGGKLDINSIPSEGMVVSCEIPSGLNLKATPSS